MGCIPEREDVSIKKDICNILVNTYYWEILTNKLGITTDKLQDVYDHITDENYLMRFDVNWRNAVLSDYDHENLDDSACVVDFLYAMGYALKTASILSNMEIMTKTSETLIAKQRNDVGNRLKEISVLPECANPKLSFVLRCVTELDKFYTLAKESAIMLTNMVDMSKIQNGVFYKYFKYKESHNDDKGLFIFRNIIFEYMLSLTALDGLVRHQLVSDDELKIVKPMISSLDDELSRVLLTDKFTKACTIVDTLSETLVSMVSKKY